MKRRQNGTTWTERQMDGMVHGKHRNLLVEIDGLKRNLNKESGAITLTRIKLIEHGLEQLAKYALGDFT